MTPMVEIIVFLSAALLLGVAFGWSIWRFGSAKEMKALTAEKDFWQQRLDQARFERDQDQEKIKALEKERNSLKQLLSKA